MAIVRSYMAHHQGMTLVALADALWTARCAPAFTPSRLSRRPSSCCRNEFRATCWLLIPALTRWRKANVRELVPPMPRRFKSPHQPVPRTHLLSNGRYAVMITAAGSGYSRWHDVAVTRWREDATCDSWGTYVFLRDAHSGDVWSAGYQPTGVEPDSYETTFFEDRAEIVRRDGSIETKMEIAVSPEDDAEVRRVSITNHGTAVREIELTSYAEVVLGARRGRRRSSGLLQSFRANRVRRRAAALFWRLGVARLTGDRELWAAHIAVVEGEVVGGSQFETDRARFLGRGTRDPHAGRGD